MTAAQLIEQTRAEKASTPNHPNGAFTGNAPWLPHDRDFRDQLVCCLCRKAVFLQRWGATLSLADFRTGTTERGEYEWIVVQIALSHFQRYGTPVGRLLTAKLHEYARTNRLSKERHQKVLKYAGLLFDLKPDADAIGDMVGDFTKQARKDEAIDKILTGMESGDLSDEKWREITQSVLDCGDTDAEIVDAKTLYDSEFDAPKYLVNGLLLKDGLTLLAGKPKSYKTWIAIQLAVAIALGRTFFGRKVTTPGRVLFCEFDDDSAQLQQRLHFLLQSLTPDQSHALQNLSFRFKLPPLLQGGATQLAALLAKERKAGRPFELLVIDPYLAVRSHRGKNADLVADDYKEIAALRRVCADYQVTGLLVHHLRKAASTDASDLVSGTTGITAAVDAWWIVTADRNDNRYKRVEIKGRSIPERLLRITFQRRGENPGVQRVDEGPEVTAGPEGKTILALLKKHGPMSPKKIAGTLKKPSNTIYQLLHRLHEQEKITKKSRQYTYSPQ